MLVWHTTRAWRRLGLILPLAFTLGACGQGARPSMAQPQADSTQATADSLAQSSGTSQSAGSGISQSSEINQSSGGASQSSSSSQSSGAGVSQSTQINQSGGGVGSSASVSTSRQVIDNGDGTVTIIETRQVDGHAESSRRTVKKSELDQGSSVQIIQQQIDQH